MRGDIDANRTAYHSHFSRCWPRQPFAATRPAQYGGSQSGTGGSGPIQAMFTQQGGRRQSPSDAYGNPVVVPAQYCVRRLPVANCGGGCYGDCYGGCEYAPGSDCYGNCGDCGGYCGYDWCCGKWVGTCALASRIRVAAVATEVTATAAPGKIHAAAVPVRRFRMTSRTTRCCRRDGPSNAGRITSTCEWKRSR